MAAAAAEDGEVTAAIRKALLRLVFVATIGVAASACSTGVVASRARSAPGGHSSTATTTRSAPAGDTSTPGTTVGSTALPPLPLVGGQAPAVTKVVQPLTQGTGSEHLHAIVGTSTLYFETACEGSGALAIGTLFTESPCRGEVTTAKLPGYRGKSIDISIKSHPGTRWELWIGGTGTQ
jgi:hypothetical protein